MKGALLAVLLAAAAPAAPARQATPPPARRAAPAARPTPFRPPLDFTGVWVLDEKASRNVAPAMSGEILNVRQTGNEIWISPMNPSRSHLLSESIVVDGRPYEKTLGNSGKGILVAQWGTDRKSLWLEVTAGPESNPRQVVQRSIWKLSADRRTWVRQSVSIQDGKTRDATLVFRRRIASPAPTPTARRASP
ncbi:MAG: hypothetical protein ACM3SU_13810 [Acidobacteriota bacterium]